MAQKTKVKTVGNFLLAWKIPEGNSLVEDRWHFYEPTSFAEAKENYSFMKKIWNKIELKLFTLTEISPQ